MPTFADRLKEACALRGVPYSQTDIGKFLGVSKQTVDRWFNGSEPRPALVFAIADKLRVNPRWLATGEGSMLQLQGGVENLTPQELELLDRYRRADPQWKRSISTLIKRASVVLALVIPPLLPSKPAHAFNITLSNLHIAFRRFLVSRRNMVTKVTT